MDAALAAGITASGQMFGDLLNFGSSRLSVRDNKKLMDHAYYLNMQQWERENEYNLPSNRMKRLKDAGLNPNLVYGNGADTTAASSPQAKAPHLAPYTGFGDMGASAGVSSYLQAKLNESTIESQDAAKQNALADAANKKAAEPGIKAESLSKIVKSDIDQGTKQDLIDQVKEQTLQAREQTIALQNENSLFNIRQQLLEADLTTELKKQSLTDAQIKKELNAASSLAAQAQQALQSLEELKLRTKLLQNELDAEVDPAKRKAIQEHILENDAKVSDRERELSDIHRYVESKSKWADILYRWLPSLQVWSQQSHSNYQSKGVSRASEGKTFKFSLK